MSASVTDWRTSTPSRKTSVHRLNCTQLETLSVDVDRLFRHRTVAFRPVEEVNGDRVGVRFGSALTWLPAKQLPHVRFAQWLRFERVGDEVCVSVDMSATLRSELRWSNLFQTLLGTNAGT